MAIKYVSIPEKRMTIAIMENTSEDAMNKINKLCCKYFVDSIYAGPCYHKYKMPNVFKAVTYCSEADAWDEEIGKKVAKDKVLKHYYRSFDKRIEMFKKELESSFNNFMKNS